MLVASALVEGEATTNLVVSVLGWYMHKHPSCSVYTGYRYQCTRVHRLVSMNSDIQYLYTSPFVNSYAIFTTLVFLL